MFGIEEAFFSGVLYSDALLHLSSEGVPETLSDLKLELWRCLLPGMVSQDVLVQGRCCLFTADGGQVFIGSDPCCPARLTFIDPVNTFVLAGQTGDNIAHIGRGT